MSKTINTVTKEIFDKDGKLVSKEVTTSVYETVYPQPVYPNYPPIFGGTTIQCTDPINVQCALAGDSLESI